MAPGARDASVGEIATEIEGAPPAVNEAATLSSAVIVNEHAPRPLQAPLQPAKSKPSSGVAASCNELPASNTAEQVPGHETPGGVEVT